MNTSVKRILSVLAITATLASAVSESFAASVSVSDVSNANMQIVTNASTSLTGLSRKVGESITAYLKNVTPYFSDSLNSNTSGWVQQAGNLSIINGYLFLGIAGNNRNAVSSVATVQTPTAMASNNFHAHFVTKPIDGLGMQFMVGASAPNASFCSNAGGYGIEFSATKTSLYRNGCNEVASYANSATFSTNPIDPVSVDFIKQGTTIRVIVNGTTIINYTDASPLTISAAGRYIAFGAPSSAFMVSDLRVTNPTSVIYTQYSTSNTFSVVTENLPLGANAIVVQNGGGANSSPMSTGLRHAYDFETLYTSGGIQYATDLAGNMDARVPSSFASTYGNFGMGVHSDGPPNGSMFPASAPEKGVKIGDSAMPMTDYTMTIRANVAPTAYLPGIFGKDNNSTYQSSGTVGIAHAPMFLLFQYPSNTYLSSPTTGLGSTRD